MVKVDEGGKVKVDEGRKKDKKAREGGKKPDRREQQRYQTVSFNQEFRAEEKDISVTPLPNEKISTMIKP